MSGLGDTVNHIGHYCGRYGEGLTGELQNSLTNIAFVAVALWAFSLWRQTAARDPLVLAAIVFGGAIGVGSLIFHSHPTPLTLQIDLWPIQIFGLTALFVIAYRVFALPIWGAGLAVIGFFAIRQIFIAAVPPGLFGGGVSHFPALLALVICAILLLRRGHRLGRALLWAAGFYYLAINARAADLMFCDVFPLGTHWLWHLLTACVVGALLIGLVRHGRPGDDPR